MIYQDKQTPFFVFDEKIIAKELMHLQQAIHQFWSNTIIAYSVKTNPLPYLAKYMNENNIYAEVVSEDEYDLVHLCGYNSRHIICNGPIKSKHFIYELLSKHCYLNIDSHAELKYVTDYAISHKKETCEVGIRVNIDIEKYFPNESKGGSYGSRFGFSPDNHEFEEAIGILKKINNVVITGLHLHVSTSTRRPEIYQWLSQYFAFLVKKYRLNDIKYFDIGGGFYGGIEGKPGWADYLNAIRETLIEESFMAERLTLIIEPGVSLLAGAFSYYMTVTDIKDTPRGHFVVTDGSRIHIDPLFHKTNYYYDCLISEERETCPSQIIVGFTCLEYDLIMELLNSEELKVGDIIRCDKLGAYTIALTPLFISYFPAVYLKKNDGTYSCIRKKWTAQEFMQTSIL